MNEKDTIRALVKASGMTQKGFAEFFGIPQNTVHNWCQGANKPPAHLVGLLGFAVEYLDEFAAWSGRQDTNE